MGVGARGNGKGITRWGKAHAFIIQRFKQWSNHFPLSSKTFFIVHTVLWSPSQVWSHTKREKSFHYCRRFSPLPLRRCTSQWSLIDKVQQCLVNSILTVKNCYYHTNIHIMCPLKKLNSNSKRNSLRPWLSHKNSFTFATMLDIRQ